MTLPNALRVLRTLLSLPALALLAAALATPDEAQANNFGTRVGARAGFGSMVFSGGTRTFESELQRSDPYGNQAQAHGLLRDGALHATALSHYDQPPTCHLDPRTCLPSTASAQVEIWDVLTFNRADLADPSMVRWRFDITGIKSRGPLPNGSASGRFAHRIATAPAVGPIPAVDVNPGDVFRGAFEMTGATMTVYFYAGLGVEAFGGGTADFGNTARFFLDLPPGVSFTSASQVFMLDRMPPTPPVPEPPTLALGLAGLGALAWWRRRAGAERRG